MTSARPRPVTRGALAALAGALALGCLNAPASTAATTPVQPFAQPGTAATGGLATRGDVGPGRRIEHYTVRSGDTATGLAVRFHAWTDELIALNDLGPSAALQIGQRLRIPVVVAAERRDGDRRTTRPAAKTKQTKQTRQAKRAKQARKQPHRTRHAKKWNYADPSRTTVRRTIHRTARRHGVDPQLALAVSWQEAGWQMHHVSSAQAIGAMQVLPDTGAWMSLYAGRPLNLRKLRDNVLAGVLLLKLLGNQTSTTRKQIAAYYQGLGAVREHGIYDVSRPYVANVLAIKRRLEAGHSPA
jgi:soluble lytic murein transglycosylase-like protein